MSTEGKTSSFLDSGIVVRSLPVYEKPPGPGAPVAKRLRLPQGDLSQVWGGEESINYIASLELKPGTVRGNHYHQLKLEYVYIIEGEVLLKGQDVASGDVCETLLTTGDLARIRAGIAHALLPQGNGFALEFSPNQFDLTDTIPWQFKPA